jgi:hypothetical protein
MWSDAKLLEMKMQDSGVRIQDSKGNRQVATNRLSNEDARFRSEDTGYKIQDTGFIGYIRLNLETLDSRYRIQEATGWSAANSP